jgi:4-diphosphocytidyl-2-C-methyl-D-erythritol kinase
MIARGGRTLAQAKINLALRVLGREADGYHSIETVFLRLDFSDDIEVRITERARTLRCEAMSGEPIEQNLAFRAAALFAKETDWHAGFEIEIGKRIPIGGGLGGGSADAAAVLRILNRVAPKPLGTGRLMELARALGADVPFLVSDSVMSLGHGRGDDLLALPPLPMRKVFLVVPSSGISTAEAYAALDAARKDEQPRGRILVPEMFRSWDDVRRHAENDFEPIAADKVSTIGAILKYAESPDVASSFPIARMTGSGSTVFVVLNQADSTDPRHSVDFRIPPEHGRVIETRTATSVVPVELLD